MAAKETKENPGDINNKYKVDKLSFIFQDPVKFWIEFSQAYK